MTMAIQSLTIALSVLRVIPQRDRASSIRVSMFREPFRSPEVNGIAKQKAHLAVSPAAAAFPAVAAVDLEAVVAAAATEAAASAVAAVTEAAATGVADPTRMPVQPQLSSL